MNKFLWLIFLCGIAFAQTTKPKAAVYIKGNPEGRDALRMAVNTFLIKSGKYQMIAVDAIDVVAEEQNRQRSGSVSDEDIALLGRDAGAQYVCVVERSESDGISYVSTSMVNVQSKIADLSEMSELPRGEKIINLIERQINSMLGIKPPLIQEEPPVKAKPTYPIAYSEVNYEDYSVPPEVDNGLDKIKPESNKNIWKSIGLTMLGAGLVYVGVHFKKETDKSYDKYSSLSGVSEEEYNKAWEKVTDSGFISTFGFSFGGLFSLIGIISLFDGGLE